MAIEVRIGSTGLEAEEDASRVEDHQLVDLLLGRAAVEQRGQDPA